MWREACTRAFSGVHRYGRSRGGLATGASGGVWPTGAGVADRHPCLRRSSAARERQKRACAASEQCLSGAEAGAMRRASGVRAAPKRRLSGA